MKNVPELLVPAGGMEQLKAAVACGADAVYLGGSLFSARSHAENFPDAELQEAIEYAHTYGVKIHVTMNTLLTDRELPEALMFAARIYGYGADAVIVQDTGLFSLIHRCVPGLPLHLSTQGTVTDLGGVLFAEECGAKRVILARELSLDEISEICRHKGDTEIEIFVHGAICIGLSGQCHMSGMIGGRSGNRGDCAQPCRMKYALEEKERGLVSEGYQLSSKDMCLLGHLERIAEAGVDSIKIEGRMKSPEYVAAVTGIYRKHLDWIRDGFPEQAAVHLPEDLRVLRQMYSRGKFTDAYLLGHAGPELMSGCSSKHQGLPVGKMQTFYRKNGHALVRLTDRLSVGDGVEIRGERGTADNVVTYLKHSGGRLAKTAESGSLVEIGDLRWKGEVPEKNAMVYKLTDKALNQEIHQQYCRPLQRVPVQFRLHASEGGMLTLAACVRMADRSFETVCSGQDLLECSRTASADRGKLTDRLCRTGGTPYICTDTSINIEGNPFIPAAALNELRRQVLEKLTEQRLLRMKPNDAEADRALLAVREAFRNLAPEQTGKLPCGPETGSPNRLFADGKSSAGKTLLQLYFYDMPETAQHVRAFLQEMKNSGITGGQVVICLPLRLWRDREQNTGLMEAIASSGEQFDMVLPAELRRSGWQETELADIMQNLRDIPGFHAVMVANPGQVRFAKKAGLPYELDQPMNLLNAESAAFWLSEGAQSVCLSVEPDAVPSFDFLRGAAGCCVPVFGRLPVMYLEHCPIGAQGAEWWHRDSRSAGVSSCSREKKHYYCRQGAWLLRDRTGAEFPVVGDSSCCRAVVYSHKKIDRLSVKKELISKGIHMFRIGIYDEMPEEILGQIKKILYT